MAIPTRCATRPRSTRPSQGTRTVLPTHAPREKLGHALGPQLQAIAADLFTNAEAEIEKSAAVLTEALAGIRATWADYSGAFSSGWLCHSRSTVAANAYHGATNPPAKVTDAIDALDHEVTAIDRLRSDETQVADYRIANT